MLTYQRYLAQNIIPSFLMVTFIITSLVWVIQLLKLLYLIDKGIRLSHFLGLAILIIPSLLFIILPFITVVAVIYTYNRLDEEGQLTILKSSGLSNFQLAYPALLIATIITLFSYYISAVIIPLSHNKFKQEISLIKDKYVLNIINAKAFNQLSDSVTIYIDDKLSNGELRGIVLFDNRENENAAILFARSGFIRLYNNILQVQLNEGSRQAYDTNKNLTRLHFDTLIMEFDNNKDKTLEQNNYNRDINELYLLELLYPDKEFSSHKRARLVVEGHQRIIWPLYSLILTFLGLSVFLKVPYNKKSHLKQILFTAIAVIFFMYWHFTFQNIAIKDLNYIFLCYINFTTSVCFSIFLYKRTTI